MRRPTATPTPNHWRRWTPAEIATLRADYPDTPNPVLAARYGRTVIAVDMKARWLCLEKSELGIRRSKSYGQQQRHSKSSAPIVDAPAPHGPRKGMGRTGPLQECPDIKQPCSAGGNSMRADPRPPGGGNRAATRTSGCAASDSSAVGA